MMGALPAPRPLFVEGGRRWIGHVIRAAEIPTALRAAMTEVWDALLHFNELNLDILPDILTDRFLAQYLGRSRRFVQKGLHGLHNGFERVLAGEPTGEHVPGIIIRHSGKEFEGRRVIQITGHLAGEKKKDAKAGRKPAGPADRKASSIPNVGTVAATTPEQVAAAQAQVAATQAGELPEPTAEDLAELERFREESRKRREAAERKKARPRIELDPTPRDPAAPGLSAQAILEARRKEMGIRVGPAPDDSS